MAPAPALFFALAFLAPMFVSHAANAGACADFQVTARGEQSRYEWLAKVKTRAHWRQKVRTMPGLGPDYSNWARAQNTEENCMSGGSGTVCTFVGTPCLP
ncbi:hypothetical protein [Hyphomicrobium methylovorum]|uniref:hypothetical protein n=1 Tax=Hyphomicrobium methylovorum TaxID=84 RepID=UPI001FEC70F8|nr:hypothetical protein [Hyphomicrobium methylovorum]